MQTLIKEDSNEEKESSSNSNSNNEIFIDTKLQPIKQSDLFNIKLKSIINMKKAEGHHRRLKTEIKSTTSNAFGSFLTHFNDKRYNEDQEVEKQD